MNQARFPTGSSASADLSGLTLRTCEPTVVELPQGDLLGVEPGRNEVIVYLARPAGPAAADTLRRALARTHSHSGDRLPVQLAFRAGRDTMFVAATRLNDRQTLMHSLESIAAYLDAWMSEVTRG